MRVGQMIQYASLVSVPMGSFGLAGAVFIGSVSHQKVTDPTGRLLPGCDSE
jgi:hypothetical protein